MPRVLGVTGGIATGKSTVLRIFAELGAQTLSADDLAREVLAKNTPGYCEAVDYFGERIIGSDGEIDRALLASIIFADEKARQALNDITHPRIISAIQESIDKFRSASISKDLVLVVEIPLLIECGLEKIVDEVLVVAAEPQTQQSRLTSRSGVSIDEAERRIASQMPIDLKVERADRVIWNDGSKDSLESAVCSIWDEIHLALT